MPKNKVSRWRYNSVQKKRGDQPTRNGKSGFVYIFKSQGLYKIGRSGNWEARLRDLRTGNPDISVVATYRVTDCVKAESDLHRRYQRKCEAGEWYKLEGVHLNKISKVLKKYEHKGYEPHNHPEEPIEGIRFASAKQ